MYLLPALLTAQIPVLIYCTFECALFWIDDKNLNVWHMSNEHFYSRLDREVYVIVCVYVHGLKKGHAYVFAI